MKPITTPKFRVSFPHVFEPKKNELSGQDEYSLVAVFPKGTDITELKKAVEEAIVSKWGMDKAKRPNGLRSPFRDNKEKAKEIGGKMVYPEGYEEGGFFMNLKSKNPPGVVNQNVQDILDKNEFYAGCWARASVSAYAYDNKGNRGVSFGLGHVQKLKDDKPLGNRIRPEEAFTPVDSDNSSSSAEDIFK